MTIAARESFLERVRTAVRAGNRAGDAAPPLERGTIGYQGAGADPIARFQAEFTAAGGQPYLVPDVAGAAAKVIELVQAKNAKRILLGHGELLDRLGLAERLGNLGTEVSRIGDLTPTNARAVFFAADIGIDSPDHLVAETGSIVLRTRPSEPRSLSLLPPVHIVVAERSHLLSDLFDLFVALPKQPDADQPKGLPSCVSVITGPSKTGDIELRLVTGVHGPGEVHLILVME